MERQQSGRVATLNWSVAAYTIDITWFFGPDC